MNTKTIKLKGQEYTNLVDEFNDHDVLILSGARGSGKSFPCAKYISKKLEENEHIKFIYMRIRDDELATFMGWCQDLNLSKIAGTNNIKLQRGKPTKGDIFLSGYDDEGILIYERIIGKCVSLESSHHFKSGKYDEFEFIVFEEFTHLKMNPENEKAYVFNFLENVISIFRNRPKHIYLMCNNLKNIPLLEQAIDELTGELFVNPLKVKIFRESTNQKTNSFLQYLNGELYEDDDFKVNISEFFTIYTNKNYIIKQHKIFSKKHYIQANKNKKKIIYSEDEFITLKYFCTGYTTNEFYYQNSKIEKEFIKDYSNLIKEVTNYVSSAGSKFIM